MSRKLTIVGSLFVAAILTQSACAQQASGSGASAPVEPVAPYSSDLGPFATAIVQKAEQSACAGYAWKKRGFAPVGYVKGVALSFARSVCRLKKSGDRSAIGQIMSQANSVKDDTDALTWYAKQFKALSISTSRDGEETLRALYTLGLGMGMRESSGRYCEGWDRAAGARRPSAAAEAGVFQVSYDSMVASEELRKLYQDYQASPARCALVTFQEGVTCTPENVLGTGDGATFQTFTKACPAFATEYAMTLLRLSRGHFGTINRREAEVKSVCEDLFSDVQAIVDANPNAVCQEVF